jgi:hypothetical protein
MIFNSIIIYLFIGIGGVIILSQMITNVLNLEGNKMTWVFIAVGFLIGGGTGTAITYKIMDNKLKNQKPVVVKEVVAEKQQEVVLQLTDLELAKEICENGDGLMCREILCLQFTRGTDSNTSGKQCEEISNLNNSIKIMDYCSTAEDPQKCLDVFWRRK